MEEVEHIQTICGLKGIALLVERSGSGRGVYYRRETSRVYNQNRTDQSEEKVYEIINMLKEKQTLGIEVTIVTWGPDNYGFGDAVFWMQLHEDMRQAGFFIKTVEDSYENFAVID